MDLCYWSQLEVCTEIGTVGIPRVSRGYEYECCGNTTGMDLTIVGFPRDGFYGGRPMPTAHMITLWPWRLTSVPMHVHFCKFIAFNALHAYKFGVDSSSHFPLRVLTHKQTQTYSKMQQNTLSHALATAGVGNKNRNASINIKMRKMLYHNKHVKINASVGRLVWHSAQNISGLFLQHSDTPGGVRGCKWRSVESYRPVDDRDSSIAAANGQRRRQHRPCVWLRTVTFDWRQVARAVISSNHVQQAIVGHHAFTYKRISTTTLQPSGPYANLHLTSDNHVNIQPFSFLQAGCTSCHATNSVKALKEINLQKCAYIKTETEIFEKQYKN